MPCALPVHIMRMDQWATCRTNHAAHAKAHVRAGIADHPDGPRSIRRTKHMAHARRTMRGRSREPPAWSMDQAGTKYVVHAKAHAGAAMPAAPGPWAGQGTGDHTHARGSPSSFRKAVNKE